MKTIKILLITCLLPLSQAVLAEDSACDLAMGQSIFKKCAICHSIDADAAVMAGPNLHGIVNKKSGSNADFPYSVALLNSPRIWTPEA